MRPWFERFGAVASLALVASPVEARLAPSEGQAFRVKLIEERDDGGSVSRFSVERTLVFHRLDTGYAIDVTTGPATQSGAAPSARMFATGMAALANRTIRFRIDDKGEPVSIDDEDAVWDLFCGAIEAMGRVPKAVRSARRESAAALLNPMRSISPERRRSMLLSMVTPLLAGPLADETPGTSRAVKLPTQTPSGEQAALVGVQRVSAGDNDALLIATEAEGDISPWRDTSSPPARVRLQRRVQVDPRTGLVTVSMERRETITGSGANERRSISTSSMTLTPLVS